MRDMQRMEIVLTSEQLRQVEELKKKDQVTCCFLLFWLLFVGDAGGLLWCNRCGNHMLETSVVIAQKMRTDSFN